MNVITNEMVKAACVAIDGPDWQSFNASLWWEAQHALVAALPDWADVSGDYPLQDAA